MELRLYFGNLFTEANESPAPLWSFLGPYINVSPTAGSGSQNALQAKMTKITTEMIV